MKKFVGKVVAVDVDLTFVDSGRAWLDWCQKKTGLPMNVFLPPQNPQMRFYYDLTKYFPACFKSDLRLFWKLGNIYDNLEPLPGAVDIIKWLHDEGATIWFLTGSLSHEQHVNKFDFLNKWCPFLELKWGGNGNRYENELIRVRHMHEKVNFAWDVLIDDRIEAFPSLEDNHDGYSILMDTPYDQNCTDFMRVDAIVRGWGNEQGGIKDHLEIILEGGVTMLTKCRKGEDYIIKEGDLIEVRKGKRVVYSFKVRYDMCLTMLKMYLTFKADINLDDEDISYKIRQVRS